MCVCVCVCVYACVDARVDHVKRGVLTPVGEIRRNRNDSHYYYCFELSPLPPISPSPPPFFRGGGGGAGGRGIGWRKVR